MLKEFLYLEASDKELADEILHFVNSCEIRKGEFEGNSYVIEKMDFNNFIIYHELVDQKGNRSIVQAFSTYRRDLQNALIMRSKEAGYTLNQNYLLE